MEGRYSFSSSVDVVRAGQVPSKNPSNSHFQERLMSSIDVLKSDV